MKPRRLVNIVFSAVLFVASVSTVSAQSNSVVDWNALGTQASAVKAKVSACATTTNLAIMHLAIYDAINSIDGRFQPYAIKLSVPADASEDAAVAAAGHRVLVSLFPAQQATLDAAYAVSLSAIPDDAAKNDGVAAGEGAANAILALRANDGRNANVPFVPGSGPGEYVATPPAFAAAQTPWLAKVTPFTMSSPSQFRPQGPPPLDSDEWADNYNATKTLGAINSTIRTAAQSEIGLFWGIESPVTQTNRAYRALALQQQLSTADTARYFAMVETAGADSCIACWDAKYFFHFWRPVTAIRAGDTDGNANTIADPTWTPLAVTPNHPEYPAAHGCYTKATTAVLQNFFGTDEVPITFTSTGTGTTHNFAHLSDVMREVAVARVYGGMHYPHSVVVGEKIGRKVARQLLSHYFRRVGDDSNDAADSSDEDDGID